MNTASRLGSCRRIGPAPAPEGRPAPAGTCVRRGPRAAGPQETVNPMGRESGSAVRAWNSARPGRRAVRAPSPVPAPRGGRRSNFLLPRDKTVSPFIQPGRSGPVSQARHGLTAPHFFRFLGMVPAGAVAAGGAPHRLPSQPSPPCGEGFKSPSTGWRGTARSASAQRHGGGPHVAAPAAAPAHRRTRAPPHRAPTPRPDTVPDTAPPRRAATRRAVPALDNPMRQW
jgi:hypothetical protein